MSINGCMSNIKGYQKKALKVIKDYLKSSSKYNCLIKMPTGTGKTGVMALAANIDKKNILIVVPNASLPQQMNSELTKDFWYNINYIPSKIKQISYIDSSKLKSLNKCKDGFIYIVTIQTLLLIYKENKELFENIKETINIIFYDEGHREPADEWKIASRGLDKKTILFTATPYRNDTNMFRIDKNYVYEYAIEEAITNKDIKSVKFEPISSEIFSKQEDMQDFILNLLENKENKILVRTKGENRISSLVNSLKCKIEIIGCHSKLNKGEGLFTDGSRLLEEIKNRDFRVVVHEDMLVEGINIPELNILVLLDLFDNYRSIIQQIGRILRPSNIMEATIYISEDKICEMIEQWQLFLKAEKDKDNYTYVNGLFKEKFDFSKSMDLCEIINFKKQAKVFISDNSVMLEMVEALKNKIYNLENLREVKEEFNDNNRFWVMCYEIKEPSPILNNSYWYKTSLEYISLYEIENDKSFYYFYYNTRRYSLPKEFDMLKLVGNETMYNLIPQGTEVSDVTYTSTSNAIRGAKTKSINGFLLDQMPVNLTEKLSYCRNATGKIKNGSNMIKRYIGLETGKVSDRDTCSYNDYLLWCSCILEKMLMKNSSRFFKRFAIAIDKPKTCITSIMLKLDVNIKYNNRDIYMESQFCMVENNEFFIEIENSRIKGIIEQYDNKYNIQLESADEYLIDDEKYEEHIKLCHYIENEHFTLYFGNEQIIYTSKQFFKPNIPTRFDSINEYDIWDNIIPIKLLSDCKNEKLGENPQKSFSVSETWPIDSVFGVLVDRLKNDESIDYLICDDMGCEIADFIALSTKENRVIFIHCKHKKNDVSASAFEDVCGQANKNIHYLLITNPDDLEVLKTRQKSKWTSKWKSTQGEYYVDRMVIGETEGLIDNYSILMKKPNVRKEVWLVTTGLSKKEFEKELKKAKPGEQVAPLIYILSSTQDNLGQAEATLKIFCKE